MKGGIVEKVNQRNPPGKKKELGFCRAREGRCKKVQRPGQNRAGKNGKERGEEELANAIDKGGAKQGGGNQNSPAEEKL